MHITKLGLIAYGKFSNHDLSFPSDRPFTMVYGPNEAGKSTSLRAITGLLYGIPNNTPDDFLHRSPDLRLYGELVLSDGTTGRFIRRKGYKDTLRDAQDKPLPESAIERYLAGVPKSLFSTLCGLDHETLRRGGEDICTGKGDLAQTLFQAATGIVGVREKLKSLESEAEGIWTARSSARPLNQKFAAVNLLYKEISDKSLSSTAYARDQKDERATLAALESRKRERIELTALVAKLTELRHAHPLARDLASCIQQIADMGDVVVLPAENRDLRQKALSKRASETDSLDADKAQLDRLSVELNSIVLDPVLLGHGVQISDLVTRSGAYTKAVKTDLAGVERQRDAAERDIGSVLARIDIGLSRDCVERLRISDRQRTQISTLARRHSELTATIESIERRANKIRIDLVRKTEESQQIGDAPDCTALASTCRVLHRSGDLQSNLATAREDRDRADLAASAACRKLHPYEVDRAHLLQLNVPLPETVDRFEEQFNDLRQSLSRLHNDHDRMRAESDRLSTRIQTLRTSDLVPLESDLYHVRAARDETWRAVLETWRSAVQPENAIEPVSQRNLVEFFEDRVTAADLIADRLRSESARVAELAQAMERKDECSRLLAAIDEEEAILEFGQKKIEDDWRSQWPESIAPLSPQEMRSWMVRLYDARRAVETSDVAEAIEARFSERVEEASASLLAALTPLTDLELENFGVGALLDLADRMIESSDAMANELKALRVQVAGLERDLQTADQELERQRQDLQDWSSAWSGAVSQLYLPVSPLPESASDLLGCLGELSALVDKSESLKLRIDNMLADGDLFKRDAISLAGRLAPDLAQLEPEDAVSNLAKRLQAAAGNQAKFDALSRSIEQTDANIGRHLEEIEAANRILKRLLEQAKCELEEDLPAAEDRSLGYAALRTRAAELRSQLYRLAQGTPDLDAFIREAQGSDPIELALRLDEANADLARVQSAEGDLSRQLGEIGQRLSAARGGSDAADLAQQLQDAIAQATEEAERYVKLRAAAFFLRRTIDSYGAQNEDPVLLRAGQIFGNLTLGSFASLRTEVQKDTPVIVGLRPGGSLVEVTAMSDGTGSFTIHCSCLANRVSTIGIYLSLPPQIATINPAAASWSSGKVRSVKRTLPVSM